MNNQVPFIVTLILLIGATIFGVTQCNSLERTKDELASTQEMTQKWADAYARQTFMVDSLHQLGVSLRAKAESLTFENESLEQRLKNQKPRHATRYIGSGKLAKTVKTYQDSISKYQYYMDSLVTAMDSVNFEHEVEFWALQEIIDSLIENPPIYEGRYQDDWVDIKSTSSADSTSYDITANSQLDILHTSSTPFWAWKRPNHQVLFAQRNPYINSQLTSYAFDTKRRLFSIGPSISYGVDQNGRSHAILGGSLQFNLIRF